MAEAGLPGANPLPAHIRVSDARLPATYEHAKIALAQCSRIDECQEWANKAEALASYARQADDDTLFRFAKRIQGRAVRRCGELLQQIEPAQGVRTDIEPREGTRPKLTRTEAAEVAGLSEHQRKTALRVANVPEADFEAAIESDKPPTVTALAKMGKRSRPITALPSSRPPVAPATVPASAGLAQATHLIATMRDFASFCQASNPAAVASRLMKSEVHEVRGLVGLIDGWLDRFVVNLPSGSQS